MQTRLNYYTATKEEIAEHFSQISRQAISAIRLRHSSNIDMTQKLNDAISILKLKQLKLKIKELEKD